MIGPTTPSLLATRVACAAVATGNGVVGAYIASSKLLLVGCWRPTAKTVVPAAMTGISNVRLLDNVFKAAALATAEYRGTSSAASSGIPAGTLPPMPKPICPTDGSPIPCGCLAGP